MPSRRIGADAKRLWRVLARASIVVASACLASLASMVLFKQVTGGWLSGLLLGNVLLVLVASWARSMLGSG
jgi:hypothetical protein